MWMHLSSCKICTHLLIIVRRKVKGSRTLKMKEMYTMMGKVEAARGSGRCSSVLSQYDGTPLVQATGILVKAPLHYTLLTMFNVEDLEVTK